ncbi:MAG TPA: pyridoxine 5'-phosphate synthase [Flavobacteriales bacterium]|nr:pyridoxine 5'-phosphate synthase [Flavobacteriales bacterium]
MTRLSVNINKIATLRNARGGNTPDVIKVAQDCEQFGAHGITVHPRPDERHITREDVYGLKSVVKEEFNIEGNPNLEFMDLVLDIKPTQVTLVPDSPDVLTSNAGWDTLANKDFLKEVVGELKKGGMRVSIFIDANQLLIENAAETGADRIELYTEDYATNYRSNPEKAIAPFVAGAEVAAKVGLGINAGHDLNLGNLNYFAQRIPNLLEVSIGHALISDSLYYGLQSTIHLYLKQLNIS